MSKEIKTLAVLSVGKGHPLYRKEVEVIITPCTGYDGRQVDATTTEEILFPKRKNGVFICSGGNILGRKDSPAHKEKVTAWVDKILDPATNKWMSSREYSERMELKRLLSKYPDIQ
jgi:hypothetical protein